MDIQPVYLKFRRHRGLLTLVILLISFGVSAISWFDLNFFESFLIAFMAYMTLQMRFTVNRFLYSGYGVADAVNRLVNDQVIDDCGGLVWNGLAASGRVHEWYKSIRTDALFGTVGLAFLYFGQESFARFVLAFTLLQLVTRFGEMYLWLIAERHLLWFVHEKQLRYELERLQRSDRDIETIIRLATEQNLLIRS